MATREENLKKINEELEKLDDEQLEQVAGGTWAQLSEDSYMLALYGLCKAHKQWDFIGTPCDDDNEKEVQRGWGRVGVGYEWHGGAIYDNKYFINGQEVSRTQAVIHLLQYMSVPGNWMKIYKENHRI